MDENKKETPVEETPVTPVEGSDTPVEDDATVTPDAPVNGGTDEEDGEVDDKEEAEDEK